MGTHGKTGLGRFLTGSVAEEVLRKAPCPVMVVKTPLRATADAETEATANPGDIDRRAAPGDRAGLRPYADAGAHRRGGSRSPDRPRRPGNPQHKDKGELIVHCLEGRVAFTALGKTQVLEAGKLVDLPAGEPHALKGIEDASLLLTILAPKR